MIKNYYDLIAKAGSAEELARKLSLHPYTIQRWRRFGVPLKYWEKLTEITGITPIELHQINSQANYTNK